SVINVITSLSSCPILASTKVRHIMSTDQPAPDTPAEPSASPQQETARRRWFSLFRNITQRDFWKAAKGDAFDSKEIAAIALSAFVRWLLILIVALIVLGLSYLLFADTPIGLVSRLWGYLWKLALFISFMGF